MTEQHPDEPERGADSQPIRVLLVDDHPVVLAGVGRIIEGQSDLTLCGTAESCRAALAALSEWRPDVMVADITLPDGDGLDLIFRATRQMPDLKSIVLSMHDEFLYAERALRAGAYGYVMKDSPRDTYLTAIRTVAAGRFFFNTKVGPSLAYSRASSGESFEARLRQLSDRELQVFDMIGKGWVPARIANALGISASTVESHRSHLRQKLGVTSTTELIRCSVAWIEGGRKPAAD